MCVLVCCRRGAWHLCVYVALCVQLWKVSVGVSAGVWGVQALCAHTCVYKGSVCTEVCARLPVNVCTCVCVCVGMHEQGLCVCNKDKQSPRAEVCVHVCVHSL